jgi:hypothetical protein
MRFLQEPHGVTSQKMTCFLIPSSRIFTPVMEAIHSFETSVLTRATQRHIPEDGMLHSPGRENLKSYTCCLSPRIVPRKDMFTRRLPLCVHPHNIWVYEVILLSVCHLNCSFPV